VRTIIGSRDGEDVDGTAVAVRNAVTNVEIRAWRVRVARQAGREVRARTRPPRAWQAWVRSASVGARRFERMEGRSGVNAGRKVAGW
jgi:hypothetical protein